MPVCRALLLSADRDLIIEEIPRLKAKYAAIAGDWESGAIAYVAAHNQVRCLILRGVTDVVGSAGDDTYGNFDVFVERSAAMMGKLLAALPGWLKSQP
jgi:adenosylhomocysteine nucleosidase